MRAHDIFQELTRLGAVGTPKTDSVPPASAPEISQEGDEKGAKMVALCEQAIGAVDNMMAAQDTLKRSLSEMLRVWQEGIPAPPQGAQVEVETSDEVGDISVEGHTNDELQA